MLGRPPLGAAWASAGREKGNVMEARLVCFTDGVWDLLSRVAVEAILWQSGEVRGWKPPSPGVVSRLDLMRGRDLSGVGCRVHSG